MPGESRGAARAGRCLCGRVRYELRGPLRDVWLCHCVECLRWHGHVAAFTSVGRGDLVIADESAVRWTPSPDSDANARRGFCAECGSSLFWEAPGRPTVSIAAGTLDQPTGLHTAGHIYVSQAADYYDLPDDGLERHDRSGARC
jgi:hypothetical protein